MHLQAGIKWLEWQPDCIIKPHSSIPWLNISSGGHLSMSGADVGGVIDQTLPCIHLCQCWSMLTKYYISIHSLRQDGVSVWSSPIHCCITLPTPLPQPPLPTQIPSPLTLTINIHYESQNR